MPMYQPHERFSEDDREKIAGRLRDAFADGRLDQAEFTERLDRLYASTTYGELEPLVRDLPPVRTHSTPAVARDTSAAPAPGTFPERPKGDQRNAVMARTGGWFGIFAVNVVIWALIGISRGGDFPHFWPMWLLIPMTMAAFGMRHGRHR